MSRGMTQALDVELFHFHSKLVPRRTPNNVLELAVLQFTSPHGLAARSPLYGGSVDFRAHTSSSLMSARTQVDDLVLQVATRR